MNSRVLGVVRWYYLGILFNSQQSRLLSALVYLTPVSVDEGSGFLLWRLGSFVCPTIDVPSRHMLQSGA